MWVSPTRLRIPVPSIPSILPGRARSPHASASRRARTAVCLFPLAFATCLVLAWAGADALCPDAADPDYLARRDLLRERLNENPGARLAVVVGSSRTGLGFFPESLAANPTRDRNPTLWCNVSHYGAGPAFDLIILDRLHRDGIRPDVAVVEVMPPFVVNESPRWVGMHLSARELVFATGYLPAWPTTWQCLRHRFVKVANVRQVFNPLGAITPPGRFGGPPRLDEELTPEDRALRIAGQEGMHGPAAQEMKVPPGADRAIRDTLQRCRDRGIAAVLLLAPEGRAFRKLYDPDRLRQFESYLAEVAREHGARLIDARDWLTDDDFADSHHPLRRGAVKFTERLVREVARVEAK